MAHHLLLTLSAVVLMATVAVATHGPWEGPGGRPGGHRGPGGRGGPHGGPHGGHGPSYLQNVSREGRKEFEAVMRNETLTISEQEDASKALAEKYNISVAYDEFVTNHTAQLAQIKTNQTEVITNLADVVPKLAAIYQNKNQTRKAQEQAVDDLRKTYPVEVAAVKFIRAQLGAEPNGGRHEGGPHGGPGGRNGGRGGGRGGHGFY